MVPRQPVRPVFYPQALSKTSCMTRTSLILTSPDQDSTKTSPNKLWPSLSPAQAGDSDHGSTLMHRGKRTRFTNEHCPGADSCQESHPAHGQSHLCTSGTTPPFSFPKGVSELSVYPAPELNTLHLTRQGTQWLYNCLSPLLPYLQAEHKSRFCHQSWLSCKSFCHTAFPVS